MPAISQQTQLKVLPLEIGTPSGRLFLVDIGRDRRLDLVIALRDGRIGVFLGDGGGRFSSAPQGPLELDERAGAITLGDVNVDGIPDLAIAFQDGPWEQVVVRTGDGRGGFATAFPPIPVNVATAYYKPYLELVDVDRNGTLDIVTGNERGSDIQVLSGDGRGRFLGPRRVPHAPGHPYYSSRLADIDRDGHLDLVTALTPAAGRGSPRLVVRRGSSRGTFANQLDELADLLPEPRIAAVADVNGDGLPDMVLNHAEQRVLSVLLNDGRGRFRQADGAPLALRLPATAVSIADLNGDNAADLVVSTVNSLAEPFESELVVFLRSGERYVMASGSPFRSGGGSFMLAAGDVNGDSRMDFATSSSAGQRVTLFLGQ